MILYVVYWVKYNNKTNKNKKKLERYIMDYIKYIIVSMN